ncbi:peptidoglycan DD-metalloendopeptidase family protein [Marinifilum sp. N1E240]|uniref:M23 family metallopeptidase n=1 Tax=Marinifilum sp. N1E240 TaxID=2608082 RepID=UPI00128E48AC|nr:M23 family metallopeptidase [Marinifilum sp. N1E240]MPQ45496.1 peptidoglycan DD-metalloendopeptidase family protein [Marinifilum sp. N1E240]
MKKFTLITGFLLVILGFCTISIKAQEVESFEEFKKKEKAKFQQFKEEYKRQFEAFKKNEQDWNKEILGVDVETPVSERVEEKDKDFITKPSVPKYVNLSASLDDEIEQIKRKVEKITVQDLTEAEPMKSPEIKPEPIADAKSNKQADQFAEKARKMSNPVSSASREELKVVNVDLNPTKMGNPVASASTNTSTIANPGAKTATNIENHKVSLIEIEKRSIPSTKPILAKFRLSSKFGNRFHPTLYRWRFHGGVDMACPKGTEIHIPADGVVVKSGWNGGYGNYIKVKHGNGYETVYGHLSKVSVKKGQKVKKGDVIGKVGSTGRSTGAHLHYEIIKNKKRVNPERFFG